MTEEIKKLIIYTRKMKKREPLYRDYPEEFGKKSGISGKQPYFQTLCTSG